MTRIGNFAVDTFRGLMPLARRRYRTTERTNVKGTGVVFDAWRVGLVEIPTSTEVAAGLQATTLRDYQRLVNSYVTIVDQFGDSYASVLVVDVAPAKSWTVAGKYHLEIVWTFLPQTVEPT